MTCKQKLTDKNLSLLGFKRINKRELNPDYTKPFDLEGWFLRIGGIQYIYSLEIKHSQVYIGKSNNSVRMIQQDVDASGHGFLLGIGIDLYTVNDLIKFTYYISGHRISIAQLNEYYNG